jgi:tetratricopeptide (TPR) repeat protein
MSIINNVLKDIEARSSQFVPIQIAAVESAVNERSQSSRARLFTLITVLLVAALGYWYFLYHQKPVVAVTPSVAPVVAIPAPVPVAPEVIRPDIPGNQIVGLQISESANDMSLEFALQSKVVSYLKERGENSFVYFLKDTGSEIVAPVINDNHWIEQLSISALDQGVEVSFRTAEGVLVETRQLPTDDGHIWAIKLKSPPPLAVPVKAKIVSPKTTEESALVVSEPVKSTQPKTVAKVEIVAETAAAPQPVKVEITSTSPDLTDGEKMQKALALQNNRRWQQAENLFVSLIDGSEDLVARQSLIRLYEHRRQNEKFSSLLRESMNRYPAHAEFNTAFARSLYKTGDYLAAIEFLKDKASTDSTQLALIAASYQRLDQHAKAVEYYRLSLDQDSRNARNWIGLGISQEHTAQLKDALRSYRIASRLGNISTSLQTFIEKRSDSLEKAIN